MKNKIKKILAHRVFKNSTALIIMQLFSYISPFLVLPLLARVMSLNDFGILMMTFSFITISLVISDFGFNLSGTYYISQHIDNHNEICRYLTGVFIIKVLIFIVILFIMYFLGTSILGVNKTTYFLLLSLIIFFQSFQPIWFFQGLECMKNITIYTISSKLIYLFFIFLFANDGNIEKVLLSFLISQIFATLCSLFFIFRLGYKFSLPNVKSIKIYFLDSLPFFLSRVAVVIYTSANTLILGKYTELSQAAIYSSSEKIYNAGQGILNPISQAFFPYLSKNKNTTNYLKFILFSSIILSIACFIVSLYAQDIIIIFFGNAFKESGMILQIFLITLVVTYLSINFGYPIYATIGKIKYVNYTVIIGAILQTFGLLILYQLNHLNAKYLALLVLIVESSILFLRIMLYIILIRNRVKNVI
ncbi:MULTISPECIES: oligosaccharide flippase family protein [Providencia]|uniref:oligosaccharide flippase family protein n=1 Tax=Providencia TaxID=586 RepID=UPI00234A0B25|nr:MULTISPECIES: oligosaccharide flippase family protein [Providencia]